MSDVLKLTCIRCPRGCELHVEIEDGMPTSVSGNACMRGDKYARAEVTNPVRVVTSSLPVDGESAYKMVSVKTAGDVDKDKVFDVMEALKGVRVSAPCEIGTVVVSNVAGTGVDIIATRSV